MKKKITPHELEKLESFLDEELEKIELTPEEWEHVQKAKKRSYKKVMFRFGIIGVLFFIFGAIKKSFVSAGVKLFSLKGVVVVATTISMSGGAYFTYEYLNKPEVTIEKNVIEPTDSDSAKTNKIGKDEKVDKVNKKIKPVYKPNVGVMYLDSMIEDNNLSRIITKKIIYNLSKKKFKLINKPSDGKGLVNILVTGNIAKIDDQFVITIKATNLDYELVYNRLYKFKDKTQINLISKKIAKELSNAGF
jgi:hypothetical protein